METEEVTPSETNADLDKIASKSNPTDDDFTKETCNETDETSATILQETSKTELFKEPHSLTNSENNTQNETIFGDAHLTETNHSETDDTASKTDYFKADQFLNKDLESECDELNYPDLYDNLHDDKMDESSELDLASDSSKQSKADVSLEASSNNSEKDLSTERDKLDEIDLNIESALLTNNDLLRDKPKETEIVNEASDALKITEIDYLNNCDKVSESDNTMETSNNDKDILSESSKHSENVGTMETGALEDLTSFGGKQSENDVHLESVTVTDAMDTEKSYDEEQEDPFSTEDGSGSKIISLSTSDDASKEGDQFEEEVCEDINDAAKDSFMNHDESSVDKEEASANNIEYVDFQESMDEDEMHSHLNIDSLAENKDIENSNINLNTSAEEEENPLLITESEKDDTEKEDMSSKSVMLFDEHDPIDADAFITENEEGADEELCIIPDTERVISEAEKEAAISIPPLKDISETTTVVEQNDSLSTSMESIETPTDKYVIMKYNKEEAYDCLQCHQNQIAAYTVEKNKDVQYLCSDGCLDGFKNAHENEYTLKAAGEIRVKNLISQEKVLIEAPQMEFERKCVVCKKKTDDEETNLTWEIMDFCNEYCLSKYQKEVGSVCASCDSEVRANSLGKYCVRFGNDIRQFCSSHCLEEYKKGLKVCSYCQKDMSTESDGFLAPVGDKGQFKDFCTQNCMEKYDIMTNNRPPKVDDGTSCSVCKLEKTITIEYKHNTDNNYFCGDPCFVAYSFVNNIKPAKCSMCRRYFSNEVLEKNTMFYDNVQYSFCSNSCQNIYIIAHRKIVPCAWCKVKKYNFDMIRRYFKQGPVLNMCSINCLSFFQVSVNAVHSKKTPCNFCNKCLQPMYHLTMSDATLRNFCSYSCVMSFQNKFKKSPITLATVEPEVNNDGSFPVPTGEPKKNQKFDSNNEPIGTTESGSPPLPVISSVQSLASDSKSVSSSPGNINRIGPTSRVKSATTPQTPQMVETHQVQVKHHIIIKPPTAVNQRNVAIMTRPKQYHRGTTVKPKTADVGCQSDEREAAKILIPIPIPTYIPIPLPMYSVPVPFPLPIAIPIPVPIFIPTTRNSSRGIMNEIKKIQDKMPSDPYEAELLMMAEMVAGDKKEENTDSESDADDNGAASAAVGDDGADFSPEPVDTNNAFGDDMLQMALKMATEGLEEQAVDLEGALTASTITATQGGDASGTQSSSQHGDDAAGGLTAYAERSTSYRGRKRGRGSKQGASKRRRTSQVLTVIPQPPTTIIEPQEKPDAHLCLKYTFGVNAWKQWVSTKNADLEKTTKYVKPFKTEILQLTADELNYSLCLFVKEVRKPSGAEYAPDTIYYLCLGIQQYLFENGRIDNIFCDPYYEQFTDSLDEVARKFSVLYNDSHYIVTRVEEEHLWESKQLGAHSPHVLLSTLMFFNTKHFNLTSVHEHMQLSFSHIMKHWKRNPGQPGSGTSRSAGSRNVLLRFYPPQTATQNNARKKKVYEQQENDENPLRCPVKLYEFYLSKCPESVKTRNDVFYLQPERSCVPDSPVWYSTSALAQDSLEKMLHRVKMVKEINVALLTS